MEEERSMEHIISVKYTTQFTTKEHFDIKLRIPNYFGYVKEVKALFNRHGQMPGEYGECALEYSKKESDDKESVFVGKRKFSEVGYVTFFISLKLNDREMQIKLDPVTLSPVFATEENMPFFEMFIYNHDKKPPDGIAGGIVYELYWDTFYPTNGITKENYELWHSEVKWKPDLDGEYRNDKRFGGTIKGATKKIPYIASLGVTLLYVTPPFDSPSQNGYDIRDYFKIHPELGTWEDMDEFVKTAHKYGIKVVCDCVFNHCSIENPLFANRPEIFDWKVEYIVPKTWWGYKHLVEFNKSHPGYFEMLKEILIFYAKHFDGIRLDVADNLPDFVLEFIYEYFVGYIMGEVWKNAVKGDFRNFLVGGKLHAVMNYVYPNAIYRYIAGGGYHNFKKTIYNDVYCLYPGMFLDVSPIFMTSHDIPRMPNMLCGQFMKVDPIFENYWSMERDSKWYDGEDFNTYRFREWEHIHDRDFDLLRAKRLMKLAIFMQYTLKGMPVIYAGDELFMTGYKDPENRKPLPWDNGDFDVFWYYVAIGKFRLSYRDDIFAHGDFEFIDGSDDFTVYRREKMRFIVNISDKEIDVSKYCKNGKIAFETDEGASLIKRSRRHIIMPESAVAII